MTKFIKETTDYLKEKGIECPEIGIILGTGLGQLTDHVEIIKEDSEFFFINSKQQDDRFRSINPIM